MVPQMSADPIHRWDEDASTHERWAEEIVRSVLSDTVCDDVRRSDDGRGVVLDSNFAYRVKVELIADGHTISAEKFSPHKRTTKAALVCDVEKSFANCLVGIQGVLFERLNNEAVADGVTLFEALPDVTKFELRVVWG